MPPGDEGTVIEDQVLPATQIIETLRTDFNNVATTKVQFKVEEVTEDNVEEIDEDNDEDDEGTDENNGESLKDPE